MFNELTIAVAFVAGLISFASPCVLPLLPGFLAYLAGGNLAQRPPQRQIFFNAAFFVLGFTTVFAALGVLLNTVLSAVAYDVQNWLARIGGLIIIFFGLYLTGIIHVGFLDRAHKLSIINRRSSRYFTSFLFGLAFAAGWTPCVGAALGAILGLAATQPTAAFYLLLAYALGLGMPFLLLGAFTARLTGYISRIGPSLRIISIVFGVVLVVMGVLVFTQSLNLLASFELVGRFLTR